MPYTPRIRRVLSRLAASPFASAAAVSLAGVAAAASVFAACNSGESPPATAPGQGPGSDSGTLPDGAPIPNNPFADGGGGTLPDGAPIPTDPDGGGTIPGPGASGCRALVREAGVNVGGYSSDKYSWYDGACKLRTAALVRGDAPGGGGFMRVLTYDVNGRTRTAQGTGASGAWNGFGYLVSHYASTASTSSGLSAQYRSVLAGANHAIHEFKMRISPAGAVDVTVHWFFATGRSHPLYAITYDATPAGADVANGDSRSPYGDLTWNEGPGGNENVDGVAWGDKFQFATTGAGPLTMATPWDYTKPNTIPYAMAWSNGRDAEMGLVQTQTFTQQLAGGDYGGGLLESGCWTKTSANKGTCSEQNEVMPKSWLWPFQLNQYELGFVTTSKRIAWGSSYGAVGRNSYWAFGANRDGYPHLSYTVAIVLGTHTGKAVESQRTEYEVAQGTRITASRGTVATSGPAGVGRTDTATYAPAGYNHVYATWDLVAASNAVTAQIAVSSGNLQSPILRLRDYNAAGPTRVRVGGKDLVAGDGYFATVDTTAKVLWVTLNQTITGTTTVVIE